MNWSRDEWTFTVKNKKDDTQMTDSEMAVKCIELKKEYRKMDNAMKEVDKLLATYIVDKCLKMDCSKAGNEVKNKCNGAKGDLDDVGDLRHIKDQMKNLCKSIIDKNEEKLEEIKTFFDRD